MIQGKPLESFNVTTNTSVEHIRKRLGKSERERKRESSRRRRRLEKTARWVSNQNVRVFFQSSGAHSQKADMNAAHDVEIWIPTEEQPQPESDLEPTIWDFVFQKAELVHELGHVLYTDFDKFETVIDEFDMRAKGLFKHVFNILEDGAIERQLSSSFDVGNDLKLKNKNLMAANPPASERIQVTEAIGMVLMDWAKWDTGNSDALLDPADDSYYFQPPKERDLIVKMLPLLREAVNEVVSEKDGARRIEKTQKYVEEILDRLPDRLDTNPLDNLLQFLPDDAEVHVVVPGEPDDAENLEAFEPDEDDQIIMMEPPEEAGGEPGEEDGEDIEAQVENQYGGQVGGDATGEDPVETDAEDWLRAVKRSEHGLAVDTEAEMTQDDWQLAQLMGRRLKKKFESALQAEQESKMKSGQRAGRPDPQSLWKLGYGESRVFESEEEPEEKDYSAVILLDRSGSMDNIIGYAQAAATGLAWALEELGVRVAVVSLAGAATPPTRLEKAFGQDVRQAKDVLTSRYTDGGTPLTYAIDLIGERLKDEDTTEQFVISITDGKPRDEKAYNEALNRLTVPALGVYTGSHAPKDDEARRVYHRVTWADEDNILQQLEGMVGNLML